MSRRGFHFPDLMVQELSDLSEDYKERPSLNHLARLMIELGVPVFRNLRSKNPALAGELMKRQYTYKKRKRALDKARTIAELVAEEIIENVRIDSKISLGLPTTIKEAIRQQSQREQLQMSPYLRKKLGIVLPK